MAYEIDEVGKNDKAVVVKKLEKELGELQRKIGNLTAFWGTQTHQKLSYAHRELLNAQYAVMCSYANIVEHRKRLFELELANENAV